MTYVNYWIFAHDQNKAEVINQMHPGRLLPAIVILSFLSPFLSFGQEYVIDYSKPTYHRVQSGETVGKIAGDYNVKIDSVVKWNSIRNFMIYEGQSIVVNYDYKKAEPKPVDPPKPPDESKFDWGDANPAKEEVSKTVKESELDSLRRRMFELETRLQELEDKIWLEGPDLQGQQEPQGPPDEIDENPELFNDSIPHEPDPEFEEKSPLRLEGYVDVYYAQYSDTETDDVELFQPLDPRSNSFGLNTFQISMQYNVHRLRATARLHFGDLANAGWPADLTFVKEAHFGIHILKKFWLDAGLFPIHLGAEVVPPKDNLLSTITLATFHEPFYQAGIKISNEDTARFYASLHLVNGYNLYTNFNKSMALGMGLRYNLTKHLNIFYGNLFSDEIQIQQPGHRYRFYNNFVVNLKPWNNLEFVAGFNYGMEENKSIEDSTQLGFMMSGLATLKYHFSPYLGIFARGEMFSDVDGVLSDRFTNSDSVLTGLIGNGVTVGIEFKDMINHYVRLECRYLVADPKQKLFNDFFNRGEGLTNRRMEIVLTTGIWFSN